MMVGHLGQCGACNGNYPLVEEYISAPLRRDAALRQPTKHSYPKTEEPVGCATRASAGKNVARCGNHEFRCKG